MSSVGTVEPSNSSSDIDHLRDELKRLETETQRVNVAIATATRRKNETSPVYRLPNELLSLIFQAAFVSQASTHPRVDCLPFNVASVSAVWRDVALSTPLIWSRIDFFFRESSAKRVRLEAYGILESLLARSNAVPIDIYFREPPLYSDEIDTEETYQWSLDRLWDNASRCRSFTFHVIRPRSVFHEPDMGLPLLQHMEMLHDGNPMDLQGHHAALHLPPVMSRSLKSLTLSHIGLVLYGCETLIEGLRSLKLRDSFLRTREDTDEPNLATYVHEPLQLALFQKAHNLEELEVECLRDLDHVDAIPLVHATANAWDVELPNLETLTVTLRPPNSFDFLPLFFVPSLKMLKIAAGLDQTWSGLQGDTLIVDFFAFRGLRDMEPLSKLLELCLDGCAFHGFQLAGFLSRTPQLRLLQLTNCTVEDSLFADLAKVTAEGRPLLCPNLKELYLADVREDDDMDEYEPFTLQVLLATLQARHGAGLQHAYQIATLWMDPRYFKIDNGSLWGKLSLTRIRSLAPYINELHCQNRYGGTPWVRLIPQVWL